MVWLPCQRRVLTCLCLFWGCSAAPQQEGLAASEPATSSEAALAAVRLRSGRVKGAIEGRDARARAAAIRADPRACAALQSADATLSESWRTLRAAWIALAEATTRSEERDRARQAIATVDHAAREDAEFADSWATRCALLPPVGPRVRMRPHAAAAMCRKSGGELLRFGSVLNLVVEEKLVRAAGEKLGGLGIGRLLSAFLVDEIDVLFVLLHEVRPVEHGHLATVAFDRPLPGTGGAGPVPALALPRWKRLLAAVVLAGDGGLRRGPSLHAIAEIYGNRLAIEGCSPQLGGHWGYSDIGGQLGGAPPGGLEQVQPGVYRLVARGGAPAGLVGNGGNTTPYAPLEMYLMGLAPIESMPTVTFLKNAEPTKRNDGLVKAEGVCRLASEQLASRLGGEVESRASWRVAVVVVSAAPLTEAEAARYAVDAAAFTQRGPDDDPYLLNFYEATAGRGHLELVVPGKANGCSP